MSWKHSDAVWALELPPLEKYVLLAYTSFASREGTRIFPSEETVASMTGLAVRSIKRQVKSLRARKVLVLVRPAKQHMPPEYRIDLAASQGGLTVTPEVFQGGLTVTPEDDCPSARGDYWSARGDYWSPNPIMIRSEEEDDDVVASSRKRKIEHGGSRSTAPRDESSLQSPDVDQLIEDYQALRKKIGRPAEKTPNRRRLAKALEAYPLAWWREVFAQIDGNPFLEGKEGDGALQKQGGATLGWLTNDLTNAEDVHAGEKYKHYERKPARKTIGDRHTNEVPPIEPGIPPEERRQLLEQFKKRWAKGQDVPLGAEGRAA